jgi:non-canonical purine NTP pyrophosphatase (RdgB/HAM1 family)
MNLSFLNFITSNPSKAEQLSYHLDFPVTHQKIDLHEIQSLDLKEIVLQKAKDAYKQVQAPVLVEDTSLIFHDLGLLPGTLIKWFLQELKNDGLCKLLDAYTNRSATAQVMFALYDGETAHFFEGGAKGTIADSPRGETGFGWDPIFIPEGYKKTWGEMTPEEQSNTSMRRIALKKLESFLKG